MKFRKENANRRSPLRSSRRMSNALRTVVPIRLPASDSPRSSESFPGLLAALRPIRRISSQLADEAVLLRRFTFKNKNQHKGCGWWRKIVEVDRFASRVTEELDGLLLQFGAEESVKGKGKDEGTRATSESVAQGLLRLPRSCLLVERSLDVLLSTASALEQLILSRAFLPFALVVAAVIARLHSLSTVLLHELLEASGVIARLTATGPLLSAVQSQIRNYPQELRRFVDPVLLTPTSVIPLRPPSPSPPLSDEVGDEEIGSAVVRTSTSLAPPQLARPAPPPLPMHQDRTPLERGSDGSTPLPTPPSIANCKEGTKLTDSSMKRSRNRLGLQEREGKDKAKGKTKKRMRTKGTDEIDDIFR